MDKFDVFYYTEAFISNRRTLSLLSILCDSVYLFHLSPDYYLKPLEKRWSLEKEDPFFSRSHCEPVLITSIYHQEYLRFVEDNRELITAGVLYPMVVQATPPDWQDFEQYERNMMENGRVIPFGLWGISVGLVPQDKIYIDTPLYSLYRWQSFSGALYFAIQAKITPISDNPTLSSIACETVARFSDLSFDHRPEDLSKLLGFKLLSSILPSFGELRSEQILEIRDELHDELAAFRYEMYQTAIQSKVEEDNMDEIIKSRINPKLEDIKLKIVSSRKAFFRNIGRDLLATGTGGTLLTQYVYLPTESQVVLGIGIVGKLLLDYFAYRQSKQDILSCLENRGLVLLLKLEKQYGK